jgi:hypothetical protein
MPSPGSLKMFKTGTSISTTIKPLALSLLHTHVGYPSQAKVIPARNVDADDVCVIFLAPLQSTRLQTPRGSRATEENQKSSWYPSLLGCQGPWSTYQDYRSSRKDHGCQEEVKLQLLSLLASFF